MHKTALRVPSQRTELLVDNASSNLRSTGSFSGTVMTPGSIGVIGADNQLSARIVEALPTNKSVPVQLAPHVMLRDNEGCLLADPNGAIIGVDALFVHRMIYAHRVIDTRRLG
jgi:hypothetical protein